jgi:NTE family protein
LTWDQPGASLARFERVALVLSGGGALGAYQAGAYAALERYGVRPNWVAGTAIGAVNAAIIAGNPPHERVRQLRRFWQEVGRLVRRGRRGAGALARGWRRFRRRSSSATMAPGVDGAALRGLIGEVVDFDRVNSGQLRVVLGATNLATGAETLFDNDRLVLGLDHVLAGSPLPASPDVATGGDLFGGGAVSVAALAGARPANTLCFAIDAYDAVPGDHGGTSRMAREIAAMRRVYDLRRMLALLGERLPTATRAEPEIRRCLGEASTATMTILHLVHEDCAAGLTNKMSDFSVGAVLRRWQAGDGDAAMSLAVPRWLAPPPRLSGVVVHEVRGGVAASPD